MYRGVLPAPEQEAPADTSFAYESVFVPSLWEIGLRVYLKDLHVCVCALKEKAKETENGSGEGESRYLFFHSPIQTLSQKSKHGKEAINMSTCLEMFLLCALWVTGSTLGIWHSSICIMWCKTNVFSWKEELLAFHLQAFVRLFV